MRKFDLLFYLRARYFGVLGACPDDHLPHVHPVGLCHHHVQVGAVVDGAVEGVGVGAEVAVQSVQGGIEFRL